MKSVFTDLPRIDVGTLGSAQIFGNSVVTPDQVSDATGTYYADAHASWCMERYRSYRIEDNTYQPFSGKRKECLGPAS
ncbi:hypothetical protein DEM27_21900 [Metarhizobium album]|uniref:Lectin-like protein BA14k n=1 Tax=Metarhizobium album TaxID=2182425 RepID=A0A2U2DL02_9HYPH|nr:BA14K family protein [Rhizobium album]PWE53989.1 hypothetical protein DEM27_21900 [Rhizobium album]